MLQRPGVVFAPEFESISRALEKCGHRKLKKGEIAHRVEHGNLHTTTSRFMDAY